MIDASKLDYEKLIRILRITNDGSMVTSFDIKEALVELNVIDSILHVSFVEVHAIIDILIAIGFLDEQNLLIIGS